jgi:hypothetical protein
MEDGQQVFTDAAFDEWLKDNVEGAAQALVAVRDLWVPADQVPSEDGQQAPALTQPDETPVKLSMQRHWPASLRTQRRPLEPVLRPRWKLLFGETPQPWAVDEHTELVWREDGQAFAFYGTSAAESEQIPDTALIVWSAQHGWLHWDAPAPADRKSWRIGISVAGDASVTKSVVPVLRWDGDTLLQRMEVDTPNWSVCTTASRSTVPWTGSTAVSRTAVTAVCGCRRFRAPCSCGAGIWPSPSCGRLTAPRWQASRCAGPW